MKFLPFLAATLLLVELLGLLLSPLKSYDKLTVIHSRTASFAPHNQRSYSKGHVRDLNRDGENDYISNYGCIFVSGAVTASSLPSCTLPEADTNTGALFPGETTSLNPESLAQLTTYKGQQYLVTEKLGSFTEGQPIYSPAHFFTYLEILDNTQNFILENSLTDVKRYEVTLDGSLVEKNPTILQRLRAFYNKGTHVSGQAIDFYTVALILSFIGCLLYSFQQLRSTLTRRSFK